MPVRYPPEEITVGNFLAFPWVMEEELSEPSVGADSYSIINRRAALPVEPVGLSDAVVRRSDWNKTYGPDPLALSDSQSHVKGRVIEKGTFLYPSETTIVSESLILPAIEPDLDMTDSYTATLR